MVEGYRSMTLDELRRRIDALDDRLVRLLGERAELVLEIGRVKQELGTTVHQPGRESAVLAHVLAANEGPLPDAAIVRLFRAIMEESTRLQQDHRPDDPAGG